MEVESGRRLPYREASLAGTRLATETAARRFDLIRLANTNDTTAMTNANTNTSCEPCVNAAAASEPPSAKYVAWPMANRNVATAVHTAPSTCCMVFNIVDPSVESSCGNEERAYVWHGDIASGTPTIRII